MLFIVSFVNYVLRNALSIAAPSIRTEFRFTSAELGWILGAFNISYTLLQIPGGIFGQRYGPRLALGSITVTWGVLTWLTGFAPNLMAAYCDRRDGLARRRAPAARRHRTRRSSRSRRA